MARKPLDEFNCLQKTFSACLCKMMWRMAHCQSHDGKRAQQEVVEGILLARVNVGRGIEMNEDLHGVPCDIYHEPRRGKIRLYAGRA